MGVFSINESHFNIGALPEVEMNEDYKTGVDMAIALVESRENEFAVLQAGIKQDMMAAMCEDYDERLAINEATASGVFGKIKEILKKLLEKLKSIFHAFMAKMNSFFMESTKFYKTYSAEIAKKRLTDFKIKAREFHREKFDKLIDYDTTRFSIYADSDYDTQEKADKLMDKDDIAKEVIEFVFTEDANKAMSIDEDLNNVAKEIEDYVFEDAEELCNLSWYTIISSPWICKLLSEKKFISDIEKVNRSSEKAIEKLIKEIDKDIQGLAGTIGTDKEYTTKLHKVSLSGDAKNKSAYEYNDVPATLGSSTVSGAKGDKQKEAKAATMMRKAAALQLWATTFQECMIKAQNARLTCAKKAVAQAKKIFAAAVAYNPKKEDYELYTAVGESAEFEAMMAME